MLDQVHVPGWQCRELTPKEIEKLGLDPKKLAGNDEAGLFPVKASKVAWSYRPRVFSFNLEEFGQDTELTCTALTFVCRDETGRVSDMAAWNPKDGRLGTWRGVVSMLGEENALKPRLGESLMVYPSPREWLDAGRDGVVIIDAVAALPTLYAASPITVASNSVRAALLKKWHPKIPEVMVRDK